MKMIPNDEADEFLNIVNDQNDFVDIHSIRIPAGISKEQFLRNFKEVIYELLSASLSFSNDEKAAELRKEIDRIRIIS